MSNFEKNSKWFPVIIPILQSKDCCCCCLLTFGLYYKNILTMVSDDGK